LPEERVAEKLRSFIDLTPKGIRQHLQLNRPIYQETAAYGHFGRQPTDEGHFPWEKLDLIEKIQKAFL
jgi:S-adenosylmethionine synthetase